MGHERRGAFQFLAGRSQWVELEDGPGTIAFLDQPGPCLAPATQAADKLSHSLVLTVQRREDAGHLGVFCLAHPVCPYWAFAVA